MGVRRGFYPRGKEGGGIKEVQEFFIITDMGLRDKKRMIYFPDIMAIFYGIVQLFDHIFGWLQWNLSQIFLHNFAFFSYFTE